MAAPTPANPGEASPTDSASGSGAPRALTPDQREDRALIARAAAGDQRAYMDLYQRYAPRVFGVIAALLGRGAEADDAFQEAMWELWRCADRYNERLGTPSMWILTIARNKAIDAIRRASRKRALVERASAERTRPAPDSPVEALALREGQGACTRLLASLPPEQSAVIRSAYLEGRTREDIAAAQNIPIGTVKTRIRTGIQTLARMLEQGAATPGQAS